MLKIDAGKNKGIYCKKRNVYISKSRETRIVHKYGWQSGRWCTGNTTAGFISGTEVNDMHNPYTHTNSLNYTIVLNNK